MEMHLISTFHKPNDIPWAPEELAHKLRELEHNAAVVDDRILICGTVVEKEWLSDASRDDISPQEEEARQRLREIMGDFAGDYEIEICSRPERFIANVELRIGQMRMLSKIVASIKEVLLEAGIMPLTNEISFSLAREYCLDVGAIDALEEQCRTHTKRKMEFVSREEFEAAAAELEEERKIMSKVDQLVQRAARDAN